MTSLHYHTYYSSEAHRLTDTSVPLKVLILAEWNWILCARRQRQSYLDLLVGQEHAVVHKALRPVPGALQLLQVKVIGAAVLGLGPHPGASVIT